MYRHGLSRVRTNRQEPRRPRPQSLAALLCQLCVCALDPANLAEAGEGPAVRAQLPVNLVEKLNSDGIAFSLEAAGGNLDRPQTPGGPGHGTYPGELLPRAGGTIRLSGAVSVKFLFPGNQRGVFNNFTCAGQRFRIPPGHYVSAHILGANGKADETVIAGFYYENARDTQTFGFPNWLAQKPEAGDTEAVRLPYHYREASSGAATVGQPSTLWAREFLLNSESKLQGLSFTYNQQVHIFAITLLCADWSKEHSEYAKETSKSYRLLRGPVRETYEEFQRSGVALRSELARLPSEVRARLARQMLWADTNLEYVESLLPEDRLQFSSSEYEEIEEAAKLAKSAARSLARGKDPFARRHGIILKSHWSELDGTAQPYWLAVPKPYTGRKPFPLVVSLHGHGWYRPFQGYPRRLEIPDAIILSPHGRGSLDYMLVSEEEVLRCIEETVKDYNIDEDRICLTGRSMGGSGTWNIGLKYADRFAALAPVAGNADSKVWEWLWRWPRPDDSPIGKVKAAVSYAIDPVSYAENLLNLPAFCIHGSSDRVVPVGHSRSMVQRVWQLPRGYSLDYREPQGAGHSGFREELLDEQKAWMLMQQRPVMPKRVSLKTMKLRYGKSYWLKLEALEAPLKYAVASAEAEESGQIALSVEGATCVTLDVENSPAFAADKISVEVNGASAHEGPSPGGDGLTLVRNAEGKWARGPVPAGLTKKARVEGPIEDAFLSPFVLVYGTRSKSEFGNMVARSEAERQARDWERLFGKPCRMKKDTEVSESDVDDLNLILYGGPDTNLVTARIMDELPIKIGAGIVHVGKQTFSGEDVGVKFCYPNPLNPDRYVVVFAGTTWRGLYQIVNRFGNWFHWGPFDNRNWFDYGVFDDRTSSPETFRCFGFFDPHWQLDQQFQWTGYRKARAEATPRRLPQFASVNQLPASASRPSGSSRQTLYLGDLLPLVIDQHKGVANTDQSFKSRVLSVGAKPHQKGIGVRAPSAIKFDIDGKFDRFEAEVSVDLEGAAALTRVRKLNEWIQFEVHGDGKCLYRTNWLQGDSPPCPIAAPIAGVKTLRLQVNGSRARWHLGSAAWGSARVIGKGWR